MSDYVPPRFTKKQLNLQNVNTYVNVHTLTCDCQQPLQHIIKQIVQQEPSIKPWLATIVDTGDPATEKDIDGFEPGELERLFAGEDAENAG